MPQRTEKRTVPYLADQMFHLVADVEKYPQFLPWAQDAKVYAQRDNGFDADMTVGVGPMAQSYSSQIVLDPMNRTITTTFIKGPFKHLNNKWTFTPCGTVEEPQTEIEFFIDFEIDHPLFGSLMESMLEKATGMMIEAFEKRAQELF